MRRRQRHQHKSAVLAVLILGVTFNTGCGPFITAIIQLVTAAISMGGGGGGIGGMVGGAAGAATGRPLVNNTPAASASLVSPSAAQGAAAGTSAIGLGALKQGGN